MHVLRTALTYPREAIGTVLVGLATLLAVVGLTIGPSSPLTGPAAANLSTLPAKVQPPAPEPLQFKNVSREDARTINAVMPFSADPNPAARGLKVRFPDRMNEARALDCLTAAVYYEAAVEGPDGQRAVAQVVLNRLRHPAYPKTVCGVVFQGSDRQTGCQFTFTCDGALARAPNAVLWNRARDIAWAALSGQVFAPVGWSTHYHTDWVVPYWASSLAKATKVGTHIFYRWLGGWGRPVAFTGRYAGVEGEVGKLAHLSGAHGVPETDVAVASDAALDQLAAGDEILVEAGATPERVTMRLNVAAANTPEALDAAKAGTLLGAKPDAAARPVAGGKVPWELRWALTGAGPSAPEAALGTPAKTPTKETAAVAKDCVPPAKEIDVKANGTDGATLKVREKCGA